MKRSILLASLLFAAAQVRAADLELSAELDTFLTTPSSANFALAISGETGSGAAVFGTSPTFTTSILLGSAGVSIADDGDGAITFLGLGNGSDENLTLNFDDTSDTVVVTTSTGVTAITFATIGLSTDTLTLTGTGTLNGLDAIDATTETTLEAALELQSLQGAVTDAQVPNTITIDLATLASTVTVVDGTDATSFVAIFDSATGSLAAKTDGALLYDAATATLTVTNITLGGTMTVDTINATTVAGAGGGLTLDASGFNGNLATTDNTLQEVAQKVDDLSLGSATAIDAIADAAGDGTIAIGAHEIDFTSTIDASGESIWTLTNTDADAANDNSFIDLRHNDGADANVFYARFIGDNDGTPVNDYLFSQTTAAFGTGIALQINGTFRLLSSNDPDLTTEGQLSYDANGDVLRSFDGTNQVAIARKIVPISVNVVLPNDLADSERDAFIIWTNKSGMSFVVTGWDATSDTDDTTLNIEEIDNDGANNATVDAVEIATNGTGLFYASDTTITGATIEDGHRLVLDFDDTDTPGQVHITIYGYFNADVN